MTQSAAAVGIFSENLLQIEGRLTRTRLRYRLAGQRKPRPFAHAVTQLDGPGRMCSSGQRAAHDGNSCKRCRAGAAGPLASALPMAGPW
jgi:hypothetical protein